MKNLITFCLFVFTISYSFSQNFLGMVKVSNSTWIDEVEVTLADYYDFLYQYDGEKTVESLFPDTTQMPAGMGAYFDYFFTGGNDVEISSLISPRNNAELEFGISFESQGKDMNDLGTFPMTGISYYQVGEYIKWRNKLLQENPDNKNYECRLASFNELKTITMKGLNQKDKEVVLAYLTTGKNNKGCQLVNFKYVSLCESDMKYRERGHPSGLMKSIAYWPNLLGVKNLQGNISEMTSEYGIAFGGNYTLPFEECKPDSKQTYTDPTPWLGFRCIVVKK